MVFASIGGLIGLALLARGIAVLAAYAFGRDDDVVRELGAVARLVPALPPHQRRRARA
jgi:hypothetical protein